MTFTENTCKESCASCSLNFFILLTVHHLGRGLYIELTIHLFTLLWVSVRLAVYKSSALVTFLQPSSQRLLCNFTSV